MTEEKSRWLIILGTISLAILCIATIIAWKFNVIETKDVIIFVITIFGGACAAFFSAYAASIVAGNMAKEAAIEGARKAAEINWCIQTKNEIEEDIVELDRAVSELMKVWGGFKFFPDNAIQVAGLEKIDIISLRRLRKKNLSLISEEKNVINQIIALLTVFDSASISMSKEDEITNQHFGDVLNQEDKKEVRELFQEIEKKQIDPPNALNRIRYKAEKYCSALEKQSGLNIFDQK